jgi:4-hydroxy-3-polyprenylbenzoate decarboxylase
MMPEIVAIHGPVEATGWGIVAINKTKPGQALEIGKRVAQIIGLYKIVVVVDKDIDILNRTEVAHIIGSRWQPWPAAEIIKETNGMALDPSSPNRPKSSKIVIDATKQWPEEGGPKVYPELNRDLLEKLAPGAIPMVDSKWDEYLEGWKRNGCPPRYS